ncbi:MAG: hypothetical protein AAF602_10350, partial [Myxococcota bacterium]
MRTSLVLAIVNLALVSTGCVNEIRLETNDDCADNGTCPTGPEGPRGDLTVDLGGDRMVSVGASITVDAVVMGDLGDVEPSALEFTWSRSDREPLDGASGPQISLSAPEMVTAFRLDVTVRDPQTDRSASAEARVLVVADADRAVFVDPDTGADTNPGTPDAPLATLGVGLERATTEGADLYLNNPDDEPAYAVAATLVLPDGVGIYGGFEEDWLRDGAPTWLAVSDFVAASAADHTEPLVLSAIELTAEAPIEGRVDSIGLSIVRIDDVRLDRVVARGSDLATDAMGSSSGFSAGSSYGVRVQDVVQLTSTDCGFFAGSGATGPDGAAGSPGGAGADGSNGGGRFGGDGGSSGHNGSSGGSGGDAVGGVVACVGGANGGGGGGASGGSGGSGASATLPFPFVVCQVVGAGGGGRGGTGTTGGGGTAANASGLFDADGRFVPANGTGGARGGG